jgi:hypothetical protein
MLYVGRKSMYLLTCGSFKSENHKRLDPQNLKSAKCHICGRTANLTIIQVRKICGLAIAELIFRPPIFDI